MSRCSTLRKIARSSANPCLRSLATASITARQPVSVHKRSNTRGRPDPPDRRRRVVLRRAQHHRLGREPRARAHQPVQLTARREHVQTPEGGDHPLADLAPDPLALRDLEIGPPARGLLAKIHRRSHVGAYNIPRTIA